MTAPAAPLAESEDRPSTTAPPVVEPAAAGHPRHGSWLPEILMYLAQLAATSTTLVVVLRLWRKSLVVPFGHAVAGDGLFYSIMVKAIAEDGLHGPFRHLGAPFGMDFVDWPTGMTFDFSVMRVLATLLHEPGAALNLYWLGSVVATSVTATFALRCLSFTRPIAFGLGLLYALLPFTFLRNVGHVSLVFHFVPPLAALALLLATCATDRLSRTQRVVTLAAAALQGLSYIYFSFFACLLIAVAWVFGWLRAGRPRGTALAMAAVATIGLCWFTTVVPSLAFWRTHGRNPEMQYKSVGEADIYGLKLRQLLTPIKDHPLPAFRAVAGAIDGAGFPYETENATARLGTLGSLGLLGLLAVALAGALGVPRRPPLAGAAAALTLVALLVAQVGGLGSVFNVFVTPDIRAYNRISVFIAFFCFTAVALVLQSLWASVARRGPVVRAVTVAAAVLALAAGVVDQASKSVLRSSYDSDEQLFFRERSWVTRAQALLPADARVFQLPYTGFPIETAPHRMGFYDHGRAYLHSTHVAWSWGAIEGRHASWNRTQGRLAPDELVPRLALAGFSGVWIDRFGYPDDGAAITDAVARLVGETPTASDDGRYVLIPIERYRTRLRAALGDVAYDAEQARLLAPVSARWGEGFFPEERNATQSWRWCGSNGRLVLANPLGIERRVRLRMRLQSGWPEAEPLQIIAAGRGERVPISNAVVPYERSLVLAPNATLDVDFRFAGKPVPAPADPRTLAFGVIDAAVVEDDAPVSRAFAAVGAAANAGSTDAH